MMSQNHKGCAIVTGGAQGIGQEIAKVLAADGFKVVIADKNINLAEHVAKDIDTQIGYCKAYSLDIGSESQVNDTISLIEKENGPIDVLINNAAMYSNLTRKPFTEIDADEWDAVMKVNVSGVFYVSKSVAKVMQQQKYGRIVNISSNTVNLGRPYFLHYVTSKAAIVGMTRSMARELGPDGITVNAIMPSLTRTNVETEVVQEETYQVISALQCIPRNGEPADIANAIKFLVSKEANFITGQTLPVDGGAVFS